MNDKTGAAVDKVPWTITKSSYKSLQVKEKHSVTIIGVFAENCPPKKKLYY